MTLKSRLGCLTLDRLALHLRNANNATLQIMGMKQWGHTDGTIPVDN